jgi:formate dehydrogenase maturation protein FdhE
LTTPSTPPELPSPSKSFCARASTFRPASPQPATLFAERALRLRQLAAGHAMRDYLLLMAVVCEALHARADPAHPEAPNANAWLLRRSATSRCCCPDRGAPAHGAPGCVPR